MRTLLHTGLLVVLSVLAVEGRAMATEQPAYVVVERREGFELRDYASYLVAETEVAADRREAGNAGFRILADYIFGNNQGARKIATTAPVAQAGAKIAMTAPVTQAASAGDRYVVQFMMPSQYTLDDLPRPNDERVVLRQVPARRVAALRYSGTWSESRYLEHLQTLRAAMEREGLEPVGEPVWARYDPPYKPWFLRTNEILIEVGK